MGLPTGVMLPSLIRALMSSMQAPSLDMVSSVFLEIPEIVTVSFFMRFFFKVNYLANYPLVIKWSNNLSFNESRIFASRYTFDLRLSFLRKEIEYNDKCRMRGYRAIHERTAPLVQMHRSLI